MTLAAGTTGATCWRFELTSAAAAVATAAGVISREKLAARLETLPRATFFCAATASAFPPGGCAYLHRHQGPGHPLPHRGRHPHRHPRPLDLVRAGRRLVRNRARRGVRAGRR